MENKKENKEIEDNSNINNTNISDNVSSEIRNELIKFSNQNNDKLIESNQEENKKIPNVSKAEIEEEEEINDKSNNKNEISDEDNDNEFIENRLNQIEKSKADNHSKDQLLNKLESQLYNEEENLFESFDKIKEVKDANNGENLTTINNSKNYQNIKNDNDAFTNTHYQDNPANKMYLINNQTTSINAESRNSHFNKLYSDTKNIANDKTNISKAKKQIYPKSQSNNTANDINFKQYNSINNNSNKPEFYLDQELSNNCNNENFKIDTHLDKIGYSMFHYRMIFIISIVFFVDGCEMSNVNMLLSSIQNDLSLNTFQRSSLSSAIFLGFFVGSFLSGFTTNKYGRLKPIKYGIVLIFIFSFITSISKSISQLIIMRILSGLAIGTVVPACKTLVTECIPSINRSFVLSIIWLLYPIGTVYVCLIALNCVDGKEFNWRKVFMVNSLSSFVLIILCQFLTESPRYLLKNGKSQEAIELLDMIGNSNSEGRKVNLNEKEKNMIYVEARIIQGMDVDEHGSNNNDKLTL